MQKSFKCENCSFLVKTTGNIGTRNRNHCPKCLYSKHVDEKTPGDRKESCLGKMKPIDIAFKKEKKDKYGNKKQGELMIVHECQKCKKVSKNRIAGDDCNEKIIEICKKKTDLKEIKEQLYGKS
jgi:hypothetical protein